MFDLYWCCAAAVLFLGCAVQTALGFGMAVVAAPVIVLFKPQWVPIILTMVALVLSFQNAFTQRADIHWQQILPAMVSRLPGTLIGAYVLSIMSVEILQLLVAGMVFVAIFVTALAKPFSASPLNMGIAGFFSGIAGTTTSIGGPPMALVMQHGDSHSVRANLSAYFTFSCVTALISYQLMGLLTTELWLTGLSFVPLAFAGYAFGRHARRWADKRFRTLLLTLCSVSGLIAIYGAVA